MFVVLKEEKVHQKPALNSNGVAHKFPRCTKKNRPQNLSVETQKEKCRHQNFFCYNKKISLKMCQMYCTTKRKKKLSPSKFVCWNTKRKKIPSNLPVVKKSPSNFVYCTVQRKNIPLKICLLCHKKKENPLQNFPVVTKKEKSPSKCVWCITKRS